MMDVLVLIVHVVIALFLIAVILLQGGRGGLGETLGGAAAQSLFGGSANLVMTKLTAVCAGLFMVTSLSLALLSTRKGRSVMEQLPAIPRELPLTLPGTSESASSPASPAATTAPRPTAVPQGGEETAPSAKNAGENTGAAVPQAVPPHEAPRSSP